MVFVAPAVLAVQSMNTGMTNASFPVFGGMHWNKIYVAARATVLRPADSYRGHLLFIAMRIAMNSACFVAIMAAFSLIRSAWAVALLPAAVLLGVAFATPVAAWCVTLTTRDTSSSWRGSACGGALARITGGFMSRVGTARSSSSFSAFSAAFRTAFFGASSLPGMARCG